MTWKTCKIHGDDKPGVWGCPECLRELREENRRLRHAAEGFLMAWEEDSGAEPSVSVTAWYAEKLRTALDVTPNALGQEPCAAVCARSPAPLG